MRAIKIVVPIVILGAAGWIYASRDGGDGAFEKVDTTVELGPITMTVETLGTVEPLSTVTVGAETTGKIVENLVDHDSLVAKDEIICRIDPELANAKHQQSVAELRRARSALVEAKIAQEEQNANLPVLTAQARGQLQAAQADLVLAEFNWGRIDKLYRNDDAVEAEWTGAKAAFQGAEAKVTTAQASYDLAKSNEKFMPRRACEAVEQAEAAGKLAQAMFDTTNAQVAKCVIRSPIDGIVLKRYMEVGTTIITTFQTPPLFLIAPSLDRMRVNAKVSESDIAHIDVGQKARFSVEGKRRAEFRGTILEKRHQPDVVQGVTTYTVILEVDNDERGTLLPGMSVNVVIDCVHRPEAVKIANAALRFKPPIPTDERRASCDKVTFPPQPVGDDGAAINYCEKAFVWGFDATAPQQWTPRPLWVGITDNIHTEILAGATAGQSFVKKFIDNSGSGFSFKEAMRQARPDNRTL
jgi:HlyD family secretion protein